MGGMMIGEMFTAYSWELGLEVRAPDIITGSPRNTRMPTRRAAPQPRRV